MAKSKFPWVKLHRKAAPEVPDRPPIWLGNRSNTEYWHPASKEERLTHRLVLEKADEQARRLGIDRREFLASSMGMFTTLAVINQVSGCGGDDGDGMVSLAPDDVNMSIPSTPMGTGGSGGGGAPPMTGGANRGGTPTDSGDGMPAGGAGGAGGTGTMEDPIGMGDGPSCPYVVPREATCAEPSCACAPSWLRGSARGESSGTHGGGHAGASPLRLERTGTSPDSRDGGTVG